MAFAGQTPGQTPGPSPEKLNGEQSSMMLQLHAETNATGKWGSLGSRAPNCSIARSNAERCLSRLRPCGKILHTCFSENHQDKKNKACGNEIDRMRCSQSCQEKIRRCSHKFCNRESMLITPLSTAQRKKHRNFNGELITEILGFRTAMLPTSAAVAR